MADERQTKLRRLIDQWIDESDGWFRTDHIWRQFNVATLEGKEAVRQRLREHTEAGRIEKHNLQYRRIDNELEEIDIFQPASFISIKFPFELEKYIRLSDGSLMVIAGSSSSGKTAMCLNIAYLNMNDWETHFFDSESGVALLHERLLALDPHLDNPLHFKIWDRMDNFADVVRPGALNIIDYLDTDSEFYMVGNEMKRILQALKGQGVVIIALQKPPPVRNKDGKLIARDLGYGGGVTIKKPQVYISMDANKLKIIKAKSRANSRVDPVNKTFTFRLDNAGSRFVDIKDEYGQDINNQEELPF